MGKLRIVGLVLLTLLASGGCARPRVESGEGFRVSDEFHGRFARAAVAADHATASAAGAEILARGGNAVDAAVATSFALSVVRPYSCGIGGGGFMVIKFNHDPKHGNLATTLNYRETTPAAVDEDFYEKLTDADASTRGGTSVAIPGTVAGLLLALEKYGTLDRATVMAPAIRAADQGFVADAHYVDSVQTVIKWYRKDPARQQRLPFVWKRFLREGRIKPGDRIRLPEQAEALRLIARDGKDAFYSGPIASEIVATIANDGGVMTADDLAAYQPREVEPLSAAASRLTLLTMRPPSSGGIVLVQMLAESLASLNVPPADRDAAARSATLLGVDRSDAAALHLQIEKLKHAFADRARWLADPQFARVPTDALLSLEYFRERIHRIDPARTQPVESYGLVAQLPEDHGTSHFSVVDPHGNAVACTETINLVFASCLAVEKYGFVLNDEMDDFTTRRGKPNAFKLVQSDRNLPQPGKRPLSSMTPTIILDDEGQPFIIAGASGGPRIITGTLQAVFNVLASNASAGQAVAAPRLHHQWQPDVLGAEPGALTREVSAALRKKGHVIERTEQVGNVQLIRRARDGNGWEAASDPRKGGRPAGF